MCEFHIQTPHTLMARQPIDRVYERLNEHRHAARAYHLLFELSVEYTLIDATAAGDKLLSGTKQICGASIMLKRMALVISIALVNPIAASAADANIYAACDSGRASCVQSAQDAFDACLNRCTDRACNDRCLARVESRNNACDNYERSCRQSKDEALNSQLQLAPSGRISRFGQSDSNSGWQRFNCIAGGGSNC